MRRAHPQAMAILVSLARRYRRAAQRFRRLPVDDVSLVQIQTWAEQNEAWNALQATKAIIRDMLER